MFDTGKRLVVGKESFLLKSGAYVDGNLALVLFSESGEPYAKLSVNVEKLENNQDFVLNHDVDDGLKTIMLKSGIFKIVGSAVYGFCESPVMRFNEKGF